MNSPLTRRSFATGIAVAVTAFPAVGLAIAARTDPIERIEQLTHELEEAMLKAYGGKVKTLTYGRENAGTPMILVAVHPEAA